MPEIIKAILSLLVPPVISDDIVAGSACSPEEESEDFVWRDAIEERSNQRLHDGYRTIERPGVAPCLQRMGLGKMPMGLGCCFIVIHSQVNAEPDVVERFGEFDVCRSVKD